MKCEQKGVSAASGEEVQFITFFLRHYDGSVSGGVCSTSLSAGVAWSRGPGQPPWTCSTGERETFVILSYRILWGGWGVGDEYVYYQL